MSSRDGRDGGQYTFPDGTIVDFGNRDPQEVLDAYVKSKERPPDPNQNIEQQIRRLLEEHVHSQYELILEIKLKALISQQVSEAMQKGVLLAPEISKAWRKYRGILTYGEFINDQIRALKQTPPTPISENDNSDTQKPDVYQDVTPPTPNGDEHVHDNFCLDYGKCSE